MKLNKILTMSEDHCIPKRNETLREKIFVHACKKLMTSQNNMSQNYGPCDFGELEESLVRGRVICEIKDYVLRETAL